MPIKWLLSLILLLTASLAGFWIWLGFENRTQMLGLLALASMGAVAALWYLRIQGDRRWRTVLDVYADRAIAQHMSHKRLKMSAAPGGQRGMAMPARH